MDFWARHPGLEKILLHDIECRWFNEPLVYPDLLPNLTHLKVCVSTKSGKWNR